MVEFATSSMPRSAARTSAIAHVVASIRGRPRLRRAAFPYRDSCCWRAVNCSSATPSLGIWPRSSVAVADRACSAGPGPMVPRSRSASGRLMTIPGSARAITPSPMRLQRGTRSPTTGCPDIRADHRATSHKRDPPPGGPDQWSGVRARRLSRTRRIAFIRPPRSSACQRWGSGRQRPGRAAGRSDRVGRARSRRTGSRRARRGCRPHRRRPAGHPP